MEKTTHTLSSESVSEGHPDKVCDYISDSVLDAYLSLDKRSRVACETLCKDEMVVLAGEITSTGRIDYQAVVQQAVQEIGYVDPDQIFRVGNLKVCQFLSKQAGDIAQGVDADRSKCGEQGAGDQGMMFGYATDETPELMPLPIVLAHRLTRGLAEDRRSGKYPWLRPDAKSQVSVVYEDGVPSRVSTVLVSTQHATDKPWAEIRDYVAADLAPRALGTWLSKGVEVLVNPTGRFCEGGPSADCGLTGRKIIVDTYGGAAHHGGGAFSGKDPSKVDRSGAYYGRYVARQVVNVGHRTSGRDPGRLRDRRGQAGVDQGRDVRNRQFEGSGRLRGAVRLQTRRHHRTARPAAADLPTDDQLRALRQGRAALGGVGSGPGRTGSPREAGTPWRVPAPPVPSGATAGGLP